MKNRFYFNVIFIIGMIILLSGCDSIEGPGIKFNSEVFDFGEIEQGESVEHSFKFKNPGNQLLEITQVRSTCGCTVPGEYSKEIEPGKKGSISVIFNSKGYQGEVIKIITITTNIPDTEPFQLTIKGFVYVPIEVNPQSIYLGETILDGEAITRSAVLINHTKTPLEILSYEATGKQTDVLLNTVKEGEEYIFELTQNPPFEMGMIKETLTIKTNIEENKEIIITYNYRGTLDIEVSPPEIIILQEYITENFMRMLTVRSHTEEKIEIINPSIHGEHMSFTIQEFMPKAMYQIQIFFAPEFKLPEIDSYFFTFELKTDNGIVSYVVPIKNGANM